MKLIFKYGGDKIVIPKVGEFPASCVVRNEVNGWRELHNKKEVRWSKPFHADDISMPYMPRAMPKGIWDIERPVKTSLRVFAPYYIPTDAVQWIRIWELDEHGGYDYETREQQLDFRYGIHYSVLSNTTLGCIRVGSYKDAERIAILVTEQLDKGLSITLEVT